jgi:uncharacterized C2H2 Zn-finger protein
MGTLPRVVEDANVARLNDLEDLLKCPVCLTVPRPGTPVYECCNSHIICGTCAAGIPEQKCPACRVIFSVKNRSRLIENIIDKCDFEIPCNHASQGCNRTDKKSMIKEHEDNCGSRPVKCLSIFCNETMNLDQLIDHAKEKHTSA